MGQTKKFTSEQWGNIQHSFQFESFREGFVVPCTHQILAVLAGDKTAEDLWASPLDQESIDFERLGRALNMIPPIEADIFELSCLDCRQENLGVIFGMTQAAISYRLLSAIRSLKFIMSLPDIDEEGIRRDLGPHLNDKLLRTLVVYFRTSNFLQTLRHLGLSASNTCVIRRRILKALDIVRDLHQAAPYIAFFQALLANPLAYADVSGGLNRRKDKRLARQQREAAELAQTFALTAER